MQRLALATGAETSDCNSERVVYRSGIGAYFGVGLLGGGVAANLALRAEIQKRIGHPLRVPPPRLCTDNGAMIGAAAFFVMRDRGTEVPVSVRSDLKLA